MTDSNPPPDRAGGLRSDRSAAPNGRASTLDTSTLDTSTLDSSTLDSEEFAELWKRKGRIFWALGAGILGRPDEIEDVLQESAMIAYRRREQFDPATSFVAWAGRIVRYVALNRARLRQRRQTEAVDPVAIDQAFEVVPRPLPFDVRRDLEYLEGQVDDELLGALSRLKVKPRACLLLRALAELDYETIGSVLGMRAQTAMSHVHRARGELQRVLSPVPARGRATGGAR